MCTARQKVVRPPPYLAQSADVRLHIFACTRKPHVGAFIFQGVRVRGLAKRGVAARSGGGHGGGAGGGGGGSRALVVGNMAVEGARGQATGPGVSTGGSGTAASGLAGGLGRGGAPEGSPPEGARVDSGAYSDITGIGIGRGCGRFRELRGRGQ